VARAVDLQEGFWRVAGRINFLSQLEGQNGILTAMNNENGDVDLLESSLRIELAAHQERKTREKTEVFWRVWRRKEMVLRGLQRRLAFARPDERLRRFLATGRTK
jgi:hypothetical protein